MYCLQTRGYTLLFEEAEAKALSQLSPGTIIHEAVLQRVIAYYCSKNMLVDQIKSYIRGRLLYQRIPYSTCKLLFNDKEL